MLFRRSGTISRFKRLCRNALELYRRTCPLISLFWLVGGLLRCIGPCECFGEWLVPRMAYPILRPSPPLRYPWENKTLLGKTIKLWAEVTPVETATAINSRRIALRVTYTTQTAEQSNYSYIKIVPQYVLILGPQSFDRYISMITSCLFFPVLT